jgi:4-carboxymuconolactone decarboxylase
MARVPYPDPKALSPETQDHLGKLPPLNLFRMMAGGEGLLRAFVRLGNHLLFKSALDPVLREIAILRVGALSGARYEVFQHERSGPDDPVFSDLQRLVMRFTDEVVADVRASDATFEALRVELSLQQLQELTVTIGYYMMASRFLETFDIDLEGAARGP